MSLAAADAVTNHHHHVALSRVGRMEGVKMLVVPTPQRERMLGRAPVGAYTRNVVYREVLL
jgi:hypothetical protein